jgi:propanediol dehydratase small subunit
MSPVRIVIGLLAAGIFLTGELVAFWYSNLPEMWIPIALLLFVALGGLLIIEFQRQERLSLYWRRACTGFRWRRRFPNAPKSEIREFLSLFVEAFGFKPKRRCCFSPDDQVMEIYRTIYPPGDEVDMMELEYLYKTVKKRYRIDLAAFWREDITLGEIYKQTHRLT